MVFGIDLGGLNDVLNPITDPIESIGSDIGDFGKDAYDSVFRPIGEGIWGEAKDWLSNFKSIQGSFVKGINGIASTLDSPIMLFMIGAVILVVFLK